MKYGKHPQWLAEVLTPRHVQVCGASTAPLEGLPRDWDGLLGAFADGWALRRHVLSVRMLRGAPNLSELVCAIEDAGYLVEKIAAESIPNNRPALSMFHGFVGLESGIIETTAEIHLLELVRK